MNKREHFDPRNRRRASKRLYFTLIFISLFSTNACTWLFFQPMQQLVFTPDRINVRYENVYIPVDDKVDLHGWYLPAIGKAKGTVLFLHGNGENISTHFASVYWLPDAGYNVLLYDYRGYGKSGGQLDLDDAIADVHKVISYLRSRSDVDSRKLAVFGQSLGAAIAINAISGLRYAGIVNALIVDSTFSRFRGIAREKMDDSLLLWPLQFPLSLLITGNHNPEQRVKKVAPIPLLVVHGTGDRLIPFHHSERIFNAAQHPKSFWPIPNGQHIYFTAYLEMRVKLVAYLDAL